MILDLVERAEGLPGFACFILIGSFAGGAPDLMSDVDSIVAIEDDSFDEAWSRRSDLHPRDVAFTWDVRPDPEREVGGHKWVSRELVLVECVLATPTGRARLADPFVVLAGDPSRVESFNRIEPITREDLQAYVERNRADGRVEPEIQARYEDLVRAVRAASH